MSLIVSIRLGEDEDDEDIAGVDDGDVGSLESMMVICGIAGRDDGIAAVSHQTFGPADCSGSSLDDIGVSLT